MNKNLRIIFDNVHDSAVLTATTAAKPVAYTQRSGRSYIWRSSNLDTQVITATVSPTYFSALVLLQHNISVAGNVRIELLLNGNIVYDSGLLIPSEIKPLGEWIVGVDPWGVSNLSVLPTKQFVNWLDQLTLADSYRITISDPSNNDGYLDIGRIFAGQYYSPKNNATKGLRFDVKDFTELVRTDSGSARSVGEGFARLVAFDLDFLNREGMQKLASNLIRTGKRSEIYINIYPEQGDVLEAIHAMVAKRTSDISQTHIEYDTWNNSLVFEEA